MEQSTSNDSKISPVHLKRFMKHLCIAAKHYSNREEAHKELKEQVIKISGPSKAEKDIELLNKKINVLLEKEAKVAELGAKNEAPGALLRKMSFMQQRLKLVREERDRLEEENAELKKALESIGNVREAIKSAHKAKIDTEKRVKAIEKHVDKKYKAFVLHEVEEKIALLESSYKKLSNNKNVDPKRIRIIEQKLNEYKEKLKKHKTDT